jgi:hypothetical protein
MGLPADLDAPLIVTGPELVPLIEAYAKQKYIVEYYGLRPDVLLAALIRTDLWDKFLAAQQSRTAEAKTK